MENAKTILVATKNRISAGNFGHGNYCLMDRERWPAYDSGNALFKSLRASLRFKFRWGVVGDLAAVTYGSIRKVERLSIFVDHCEYLSADKIVRAINRSGRGSVHINLFPMNANCLLIDQYDSERYAAGTKWPVISAESTVLTQLSKVSAESISDVIEMIRGECEIDWEHVRCFADKFEVEDWLLDEFIQIEKMMGCNQDPTKPENMRFSRL